MNTRLQQFLELENLTPARLADILGVQRSGMSHILSGRNKPGYDFIYKLLTKFPSLSADWFLTGKGKPYKEMNIISPTVQYREKSHQPESRPSPNQPGLVENDNLFDFTPVSEPGLSSSSGNRPDQNDQNAHYFTENENINHIKPEKQLNEIQINGTKQQEVRKNRCVKRVIIFYNDGTFDELFPQK